MRGRSELEGPAYEVVACIAGRGFKQRKQDMRKLLEATRGKVFTLQTLSYLVEHTRLNPHLPDEAAILSEPGILGLEPWEVLSFPASS
jgi:hypothetical protein